MGAIPRPVSHSVPLSNPRIEPARLLAVVSLIAFAAFRSFCWRHYVVSDDVPYLAISDAFLQGHWRETVYGLWSPLFPAVIAAVRVVFSVSSLKEAEAVNAATFISFLFSLIGFEFLLYRIGRHDKPWMVVAYGLFGLVMATLALPAQTPDLLMAGFLFIAAGMLLQFRTGGVTLKQSVALGVCLGFGYLAKAPFFVIGVIILIESAFLTRKLGKTAIAAAVAALISAPLIVGLHHRTGRLTFSDSGRINYLVHVNKRACRVPLPTSPPLFIDTTGTDWYLNFDLACASVKPEFSLGHQLAYSARITAEFLQELLFRSPAGMLIAAIILIYGGSFRWRLGWPLILLSLLTLGMYCVVHIELRYMAAFLVLSIVAVLEKTPLLPHQARRFAALCVIIAIVVGLRDLHSAVLPATQQNVAKHLLSAGTHEGEAVAVVVGNADTVWVRFVRARVVASVPLDDAAQFWRGNQNSTVKRMREAGASAIVTSQVPANANLSGWTDLGSGYFLRWLR